MNSQPKVKENEQGTKKNDAKVKTQIFPKKKFQFKTEDTCPHCKMSIPLSSIDNHVNNCKKKPKAISTRKITVYNSAAVRIQGTDIEAYQLERLRPKPGQGVAKAKFAKSVKPEINRSYKDAKKNSIVSKIEITQATQSQPPQVKIGKVVTKEKGNSKLNATKHTEPQPPNNWREVRASTLESIRQARRAAVMNNNINQDTVFVQTEIFEGQRRSPADPSPSRMVMDLYIPNENWTKESQG